MGAPSVWGSWGPTATHRPWRGLLPGQGLRRLRGALHLCSSVQPAGQGGSALGRALVLEGLGHLCPWFPGGFRRSLSLFVTAPSSVK